MDSTRRSSDSSPGKRGLQGKATPGVLASSRPSSTLGVLWRRLLGRSRSWPAVLVCAVGLCFSGCSTVTSRIEEKSAVFSSLNPQDQARIRQGLVDVGFTPDMVYMALGRPSSTREKTSGGDAESTWIYNTYWQEYEGSHLVGYRRHAYFDERVRAWRIYYEPVHATVYSEREEEYIRVTFKGGKVIAIEQTKE